MLGVFAMIKVSHLTILENERHLISDVSFVLPNTGLCTICANEKEAEKKIAYILSGLLQANQGYVECNGFIVDSQEKQELYRQQYVANLLDEFIIFPEASIKDNVVLHYSYASYEINNVLKQWDLTDIAYESIENQSFEVVIRVILARMCIRKYKAVVFYPNSTPYAEHELQQIFQALNICSSFMLVIVVGYENIYANRNIELRNGKIVSDNGVETEIYSQVENETCRLSRFAIQHAYKMVEEQYRWVYKIFTCLMCVALFFISILWCAKSLNTVDIEMSMLKKDNTNSFLIEKIAQGNNGKRYPLQREELNDEDVEQLNDIFKNQVFFQYEPIDKVYANAYLEGIYRQEDISVYNKYPVTEFNSIQFKSIRMIGEKPTSYNEVVVPLSMMDRLFVAYDSNDIEKYLGEQITWYGMKLKVSGIITDYDYIHFHTFYVKKGFIKQHYLRFMQTAPISYKRMLIDDKYFSIQNLKPLEEIECFYDGEKIQYNQPLKGNEVLLNVGAAVVLGFPYESYMNDYKLEYSDILDEYLKYTQQWIGKEIQIQSYTIENEALNSMKYRKDFVIKGFLINGMNIVDTKKESMPSIVYIQNESLKDYMIPNIKITNAIFQSDHEDELENALILLDHDDTYKAKLENSSFLQLLIVDVKNLTFFFMVVGFTFLIGASILSFILVNKINDYLRKIYSVYYGFGESLQFLKQQIKFCFLEYWKKSLLLSTGIVTLIIWVYLLIIFITLSSDTSLLRYCFLLMCPSYLSFFLYECISFFMKVYLKKHKLLMEAYEDVC